MKRNKKMKNLIVKLDSIKMNNFKNVIKSEIAFSDKGKILNTIGIYGQNGSGKTAVVESINILKSLLMDIPFQKDLYYYINICSNELLLDYKFIVNREKEEYSVKYLVKFERDSKFNSEKNIEEKGVILSREKIEIYDMNEKLLAHIDFKKDKRKTSVIYADCNVEDSDEIISNDIAMAAAHISSQLSKTVIFQDMFRENIKKSLLLKNILNGMNFYATANLFVIGMKETSLISAIDNLPLSIRASKGNNSIAFGTIPLNMFAPSMIPSAILETITPELEKINIVMRQLVPGIKIGYKKINEGLDKNGNTISTIQLVSIIGESQIPLKYESEGVKKLIALCSVLIEMYNNEAVCLVVDELDSGIFEYLLGELVKILHDGAKGQLIFTSHNLRLLEVLPKQCIIFSTINPQKSFIKMANVKPNHNLRDFYYRTILLGGQKEELYNETDEYEIERALRKCQTQKS